MSWSPNFIAALREPKVSLRWAVETFGTALGDGVGRFPIVYSSHPVGTGQSILDPRSVRVGSHSVSIEGWAYRKQSWSFRLVAPQWVGSVAETLRPGTLIRLRCDALGFPYGSGWEVVQSGVVADVRWQAGDVAVTVYDLLTGLRQRFGKLPARLPLFPSAGTSTTVAGTAYTAGAASIQIAATAGFDELALALPDIALVTPTGGGTPFFVTYTGISGSSLTGLTGFGARGTTPVNAAIGSTVTQYAHHSARVDQILARTLVSTGTGASGTYDVLPDDWAYALPESVTIDAFDMVSTWGNAILGAVSGGSVIDIAEGKEQGDGLAWLQALLSRFAVWPVNRQGRISIRMAQDPAAVQVGPALTIKSEDILAGQAPEVQWYHPDRRTAYYNSRVDSASGTTTDTGPAVGFASYPASGGRLYDLSEYVFDNEASVRADLARRVAPWDTSIPERVILPLQSCAWAQLVPGDLVRLDLPEIADRYLARGRLASTTGGYSGRIGMVDEVSVDWQAGSSVVGVAIAPTSAADNRQ